MIFNKPLIKDIKASIIIVIVGIGMVGFGSCKPSSIAKIQRDFYAADSMAYIKMTGISYLKVHTKDGELFILEEWEFQKDSPTIKGLGAFYDVNRQVITKKMVETSSPLSYYTIALDSVDYYETNTLGKSNNQVIDKLLVILSGVTVGFTALFIGLIIAIL